MFDGKNYPYWKFKMRTHMKAIDPALCKIVEEGFLILNENELTIEDLKNKQLDSQACDILFDCLSEEQFGRISALTFAKKIWDILQEVNEGTLSVKESRLDVLQSKLNRFKRNDGETVNDTYSRLMNITNEHQGPGAYEVTNNVIVKKRLRSLDEKFDTLCTLIQEHPNFKNLTAS